MLTVDTEQCRAKYGETFIAQDEAYEARCTTKSTIYYADSGWIDGLAVLQVVARDED